jgi:hypothetical protein
MQNQNHAVPRHYLLVVKITPHALLTAAKKHYLDTTLIKIDNEISFFGRGSRGYPVVYEVQ